MLRVLVIGYRYIVGILHMYVLLCTRIIIVINDDDARRSREEKKHVGLL